MITKYGPPSKSPCLVPDYAEDSSGSRVYRELNVEDKGSEPTPLDFELDDSKWFAIESGQIIRFPREREWDWRTKRAREIVTSLSSGPLRLKESEEKLSWLEAAAALCGFSIIELVSRLNQAKLDGEDLVTVFNRIKPDR